MNKLQTLNRKNSRHKQCTLPDEVLTDEVRTPEVLGRLSILGHSHKWLKLRAQIFSLNCPAEFSSILDLLQPEMVSLSTEKHNPGILDVEGELVVAMI